MYRIIIHCRDSSDLSSQWCIQLFCLLSWKPVLPWHPPSLNHAVHDDDVPLAAVLICPFCHCLLEEGVKAQYLRNVRNHGHQHQGGSSTPAPMRRLREILLIPHSLSIHLLPKIVETNMTQKCLKVTIFARPSPEKHPCPQEARSDGGSFGTQAPQILFPACFSCFSQAGVTRGYLESTTKVTPFDSHQKGPLTLSQTFKRRASSTVSRTPSRWFLGIKSWRNSEMNPLQNTVISISHFGTGRNGKSSLSLTIEIDDRKWEYSEYDAQDCTNHQSLHHC